MNFLQIVFLFFCFLIFILKSLIIIFLIKKFFHLFFRNLFIIYFYFKSSSYDVLYQLWYKFARNQKSGYLALRYRLVYLNKKFVQNEILNNDKWFQENIQEYFILKRKNFGDTYLRQTRVRRFVPLYYLKRKFYSKIRRNFSLKGLFFFYLKDFEDRINNKEKQQKNLRIYETKFGTYVYQELIKKGDQKQSKFIKMRLHRDDKINFFE